LSNSQKNVDCEMIVHYSTVNQSINADQKIFSSTATADRKGGLSMATKKVAKKAPAKKAPAKKLAAKKPAAKKAVKKAPAKKAAKKK